VVRSIIELTQKGTWPQLDIGESYLSFLPLAHVFERVVITVLMVLHGSIGFSQGDTLKLVDDLHELRYIPYLYDYGLSLTNIH